MKNEEFNTLINNMKEKLGEENTSLIADDLGLLITDNSQMNSDLNKKDDTIQKLQNDKETLIKTNGNLLQQVAMGEQENNFNMNNKEDTKKEPFSFKKQFDKNGEFID